MGKTQEPKKAKVIIQANTETFGERATRHMNSATALANMMIAKEANQVICTPS
jgi:cystathionine beta-lyase/cystathionine gamma-synthase